MPDDELAFQMAGEEMIALADRALFWPRERALFAADLHFGKDATFRHARCWVPPGTTADDLRRLSTLISRYRPRQLIILGDAFHSEHAAEPSTFEKLHAWRATVDASVLMVRGNHDRRAGEIARQLNFQIVDEGFPLPPFSLRHHPATIMESFTLCGHLHPLARVRGVARQSLRVPCFWASGHQCVLPAFGGFTGGSIVHPARTDRVILVADDRVMDAADCSPTPELSRLRNR